MKLVSFLLAGCALMVLSPSSFAQNSAPPRYEVGGQVSIINFNPIFDFKRIEVGGEGRFTFNINEYLAAETQVDFFKKYEPLRIATVGLKLSNCSHRGTKPWPSLVSRVVGEIDDLAYSEKLDRALSTSVMSQL